MMLRVLLWLIVLVGSAAAQHPGLPALTGHWLTENRTGIVSIEPCADRDDGALCGRVIGLVLDPGEAMPVNEHGVTRCQLTIMHGMRPNDSGGWSGQITDPRTGHIYDIGVHLDAQGQLRMRGYVIIPLFGSTQTWTRYPGPVPPACRMAAADVANATAGTASR